MHDTSINLSDIKWTVSRPSDAPGGCGRALNPTVVSLIGICVACLKFTNRISFVYCVYLDCMEPKDTSSGRAQSFSVHQRQSWEGDILLKSGASQVGLASHSSTHCISILCRHGRFSSSSRGHRGTDSVHCEGEVYGIVFVDNVAMGSW